MLTISLEKDVVLNNADGSKTIWSKDVFDILVEASTVNPSEKILRFNILLLNKTNGFRSSSQAVRNDLEFTRVANQKPINQKEFDDYNSKKNELQARINEFESFVNVNEPYLKSSELMDDEKATLSSLINQKKEKITKTKEKLAALKAVEIQYESGEDYDSVVRDYFTGFALNDKGKTWLTALVKKNI